jgi:AAA domain
MDDTHTIKLPPRWGTSTPPGYNGPGTPLDEAVDLLVPPGRIIELRVIGGRRNNTTATLSGRFDDLVALKDVAWRQGAAGATAIFATMNELRPDPARPVTNWLDFARDCATDDDIERIQEILIDIEADREADSCATEEEHVEALQVGARATRWLHEQGAYATLVDSGNGAHVRITVALPNDGSTRELVERVMAALARRFNTARIKIDLTTGNPSRLARLPGTMNRKGASTPDRPHRRSQLLAVALRNEITPRDVLEAIASTSHTAATADASVPQAAGAAGQPSPQGVGQPAVPTATDIRALLEQVGLTIKKEKRQDDRCTIVLKKCPFNDHQHNGKAYVTVFDDGGVAAGCLAAKCKGKRWRDLVALYPALDAHREDEHQGRRVIRLDSVQPEPVKWLWPDRIPRRKVSIWFGDPGAAKSKASCAVAAAVSTGAALPDAQSTTPASVLFFTNEDGAADTIVPRLDQGKAERSRIYLDHEPLTLDESGLSYLRRTIERHQPALVFIDSLEGYTGARVDMHRGNHVRPMFSELGQIAEQCDCAIVVIHHANKSEIRKAIHRVTGSVGIVAAVRMVQLFGVDPLDENAGAMITVKANISPVGKSTGYRIEPFEWTGASQLTADDLLGPQRADPMLQEAIALLERALANGPRPVDEVSAEARAYGISQMTLRRARQQLGIQPTRVYKDGKVHHWVWSLPVPAPTGS